MGQLKSVFAILLAAAPAGLLAAPPAGAGGNDEERNGPPWVRVPLPPWPAGDERGMGNTQGVATRLRCAEHLANPRARAYELSHERSQTMPVSPFGVPLAYNYHPTSGVAFTRHVFNGEDLCGEPAAQ